MYIKLVLVLVFCRAHLVRKLQTFMFSKKNVNTPNTEKNKWDSLQKPQMVTIYKVYTVRRFLILIAFTCTYTLQHTFNMYNLKNTTFSLVTFTLFIKKCDSCSWFNRWIIRGIKLQESIIVMKDKKVWHINVSLPQQ